MSSQCARPTAAFICAVQNLTVDVNEDLSEFRSVCSTQASQEIVSYKDQEKKSAFLIQWKEPEAALLCWRRSYKSVSRRRHSVYAVTALRCLQRSQDVLTRDSPEALPHLFHMWASRWGITFSDCTAPEHRQPTDASMGELMPVWHMSQSAEWRWMLM